MQSFLARLSAHPMRAVAVLCLVLFLSGNWILPLLDRDEPRFAEASREMLQRHDFIIPWFNGGYRLDKPPLIYWCQIASYRILGENPFAARLPSALFASATALLLIVWGRRLGNARAGFFAAIMFASCLQVLINARAAVADMPMVFFFTGAVWSGWELTRPEAARRSLWWWMFFFSLALGFLAKGPIAWLPLGILLLGRWRYPERYALRFDHLGFGVVLTLALIGAWGIPALLATRGQFFTVGIGRHVIHRSFGIMEGHGAGGLFGFLLALPLYFLTFFPSFFPWSLQVPRTLRVWWRAHKADVFGSYLLAQAALVFAVFTIVRTKLPHYTLPAFPCLALWLGLRLSEAKDSEVTMTRGLPLMSLLALALTLPGFAWARTQMVTANLWQQVRPHAQAEMEVAFVEFSEPSLVWEFRELITNHLDSITIADATAFLHRSSPRILVLPTAELSGPLRELATNAVLVSATGIETVQFKHWHLTVKYWDLTAIVKP